MKNILRVSNIRALSALLAVLLTIPLSWKGLTGFYTWLSPFIMLNSVFVLKSFVFLNLAGFIIVLLVLLRNRWFCRYLCPVGWSCDLVSRFSRRKTSDYKHLPEIGKWIALLSLAAALAGLPLFILLDPMAIFYSFFTAISVKTTILVIVSLSGFPVLLALHLYFPGIWCNKLCPLGGLQGVLSDIKAQLAILFARKNSEQTSQGASRRLFIASGIGLTAGFLIPGLLKPGDVNYIRPPASVKPELFNTLCIRCGNCIKVCPTGIITHHTLPGSLLAWMTPEVRYADGYCLETCNLCSKVCPSGSITLFNVKAKNQLFMGTAEVHLANCLLTKNTECDRCKVSCKFAALEIVPDYQSLQSKPVIETSRCVGCGACAVICPESTIFMKPPLSV